MAADLNLRPSLQNNFEDFLTTHTVRIEDYTFEIDIFDDPDLVLDHFCSMDQMPHWQEQDWPLFGALWPASIGLCRYLYQKSPQYWHKRRVLELGCGLAVPSMLLSKLGAKASASDRSQDAKILLEHNLQKNELNHVRFYNIDWEAPPKSLGPFDTIIGSDILYDPVLFDDLLETIHTFSQKKTEVIISDIGRIASLSFFELVEKHGFTIEKEEVFIPDSNQSCHIYRFCLDH